MKKSKNINMLLNKENKLKVFNNLIYFMYIFLIMYIIFVSGIIYYISSIKDCSCFIELNKSANVNIQYIYIIEIIILFLIIIIFFTIIILHYRINNLTKGGMKQNAYIFLIQYIIILAVYGYLVYNVYKLYQIPDDDCNCMKNWLKYLLYIQVILMIIGIIMQTNTLINLFKSN